METKIKQIMPIPESLTPLLLTVGLKNEDKEYFDAYEAGWHVVYALVEKKWRDGCHGRVD